ncbi:uncharacterized protein LOC110920175 [Helianthus annuus]|uniref:uncharacterized protein LOC110920175 n=1 Tax=Helianthus annuus TaxID=4232 RepID=UPI000B907861|nr:uncharacterized protein LOC110920175 [Helianthus annuus]
MRDQIRPFIWSSIGDGKTTSAWFDKWSDVEPIGKFISPRLIHRAGFDLYTTVADVNQDGQWRWPAAWLDLFPVLNNLPQMNLQSDRRDSLVWRDNSGRDNKFSTKVVWDSIRRRSARVGWIKAVWFSHCIPRHAFLMWLIMGQKLKTQDKINQWRVWDQTKKLGGTQCLYNQWDDILNWLTTQANSKSAKNVIGKLVVVATA